MAHYATVLLIHLATVILSALALPQELTNPTINEDCPVPFLNVWGHCLYFNTLLGTGTWNDMRTFCHSLQGEMLKFNNAEFYYEIVKFIEQEGLSPGGFWIGGTDEGHEGDWRWTDNTPMNMGTPFWALLADSDHTQEPVGGPNSNCAVIHKSYKYFITDDYCTNSYSVICEYTM